MDPNVAAQARLPYEYRGGDEVVFVLAGAEAHNIERGAPVDARCMPPWSIGVVIGRRLIRGRPGYAVRMEHDGCACVCVVPESSIEGLA